MSGWAPIDVDWWTVVAAALPLPWPREAILMDLRMWADAERMGRASRPGRPSLAKRWGVTDWAAKEALKAEAEWADPSRKQDPPADHQRAASDPPADRQPPKGQTPKTVEDPPADHQRAASDPPADRPTRVVDTEHPTPITNTDRSEQEQREPTALVLARPEQPAKKPKANAIPDEIVAALAKYGYQPNESDRAGIPKLLKAGRMPADVISVIVWAYGSNDSDALWLRGANEHRKNYTRAGTLWRPDKFAKYLDAARGETIATETTQVRARASPAPSPFLGGLLEALADCDDTKQSRTILTIQETQHGK